MDKAYYTTSDLKEITGLTSEKLKEIRHSFFHILRRVKSSGCGRYYYTMKQIKIIMIITEERSEGIYTDKGIKERVLMNLDV